MHFIELADEAFFIGAWGKAIDLYEQVLKIEENWARAKEYLEKSKENFNNHVSPPTLSIPGQLRTLVTQAESAITHWNLDNAESYITRAYAEVKNLGMRSWENLDTVSETIKHSEKLISHIWTGKTSLLMEIMTLLWKKYNLRLR